MSTTHSTPHLQRRRSSRAAPGEKFDGELHKCISVYSYSCHFKDYIIRRKAEIEQEHKRISIYTSPLLVSSYFIMFAYYEARAAISFLCSKGRVTVGLVATIASMIYIAYQVQGPHQQVKSG